MPMHGTRPMRRGVTEHNRPDKYLGASTLRGARRHQQGCCQFDAVIREQQSLGATPGLVKTLDQKQFEGGLCTRFGCGA